MIALRARAELDCGRGLSPTRLHRRRARIGGEAQLVEIVSGWRAPVRARGQGPADCRAHQQRFRPRVPPNILRSRSSEYLIRPRRSRRRQIQRHGVQYRSFEDHPLMEGNYRSANSTIHGKAVSARATSCRSRMSSGQSFALARGRHCRAEPKGAKPFLSASIRSCRFPREPRASVAR